MRFNRSFKAHPVMALYYLKPFLFFLLIPLLTAFYEAFKKQNIDDVLIYEWLLFLVIIGYSVIKWKMLSITLTSKQIKIRTGVFFRRTSEIPIDKISSIQTVQHLTDRIFSSITVRINTESGRKGKADFEVKLFTKDADTLFSSVFNIEKTDTVKFSPISVSLMAASCSSAFTGLIFIVPIIRQAGVLLGTAIEEIVIARINELSLAVSKVIPPIVNTVTVIFLILYGISFLISFFKYVNFKVRVSEKIMDITGGLLTRFHISFKIKAINSAIIEQNPLMRLLGKYLLKVSIGGYGDNKGYKAVVIPSANKKEVSSLFADFFPRVKKPTNIITPSKSSRKRFYFIPTICLLAAVLIYFVALKLFPVFNEILTFAFIISVFVLLYYYTLAEYNTRQSAISVNDILYAKYTRWSATREMFCVAGRVGLIHISRWPIDKMYKTCNIKIIERSESAESITVKHIDYEDIKKQLYNFYTVE